MKIKKAAYIKSAALKDQYINDEQPQIVLLGRSNVGKSSFINSLVNMKKLARASSEPGKTQTANYYLINDTFYIVDMPGYGYAKTSKKTKAKFGGIIEYYLLNYHPSAVMLLVDIRHEPTENDILMYEWLKYNGYEPYIILTKADKISKNEIAVNAKKAKQKFNDLIYEPIIYSSHNNLGREHTLNILSEILGIQEE
ncbi:MAG: ribosome biogenesis GTP-binding protein YihA/YsxC [Eubacteriaceae bacterium]